MNTKNTTHERISAFADGELADGELDAALATLRTPDGRVAWDIYHQIGDTLRSDEMAMQLSPNFASRLAMRLENEPVIIAPAATQASASDQLRTNGMRASAYPGKRFFLQGMAAMVVVAALAFVASPQLPLATKAGPAASGTAGAVAAASATNTLPASANMRVVVQQQGEVLRDSGIDEYLLAHQRFSPSVYSTAQYARSATFAIDSDK